MIRLLMTLLRPLPKIAEELQRLRELYELDLASRTPPIYRFTEQPKQSDTEVTYQGIEDKRKSWKIWSSGPVEEEDMSDGSRAE